MDKRLYYILQTVVLISGLLNISYLIITSNTSTKDLSALGVNMLQVLVNAFSLGIFLTVVSTLIFIKYEGQERGWHKPKLPVVMFVLAVLVNWSVPVMEAGTFALLIFLFVAAGMPFL